jgi:hypothetical protein
VFVAFGECRDPYRLKLARSWKMQMEDWCRLQFWLEKRGNPNAWNHNAPTRARFLRHFAATEDDIEDGMDLMNEIGFYHISDEYRTKI